MKGDGMKFRPQDSAVASRFFPKMASLVSSVSPSTRALSAAANLVSLGPLISFIKVSIPHGLVSNSPLFSALEDPASDKTSSLEGS